MSSQTHGFLFQFSHGSKSEWDGVQKLIIVNLEGVEYKDAKILGKKRPENFSLFNFTSGDFHDLVTVCREKNFFAPDTQLSDNFLYH